MPEASTAATTPVSRSARRAPSAAISGHARDGEDAATRGAGAVEPAAEVDDDPGEDEVERRAAALGDHRVQEVARADPRPTKSASASSSCGGHVCSNEPSAPASAAASRRRRSRTRARGYARARARRSGPRAASSLTGAEAIGSDTAASVFFSRADLRVQVPERARLRGLQADRRSAAGEVSRCCGASPVETVLYPVPVHFRGSGFYSTDYGRGSRKKEPAKDSGDGSASADDKKDKPTEKKAAEA